MKEIKFVDITNGIKPKRKIDWTNCVLCQEVRSENSISRGQFFREFLFGVTLISCKIFHRQENGAGIKLIEDTRQFGLLYLMFGRVCRSWSLALARRGAKVGASVWRRAWSAAHFVIVKETVWKTYRLKGNLTNTMYTFYVKMSICTNKMFSSN